MGAQRQESSLAFLSKLVRRFVPPTQFPFIIFLTFLLLTSCSSLNKKDSHASWFEGTQGLLLAYSEITPYLYNQTRYSDPNNRLFIKANLMQIKYYSSLLSDQVAQDLFGDDPATKASLKRVRYNVKKGIESYLVDNYGSSQKMIHDSLVYFTQCNACGHLRGELLSWNQFSQDVDSAYKFTLAKIYTSSHQFDPILQALVNHLHANKLNESERMEILKLVMMMSIKNMNSPQKALALLETLNTDVNVNPDLESENENEKVILRQWKIYLRHLDNPPEFLTLKEASRIKLDFNNRLEDYVKNVHRLNALHKYIMISDSDEERAQIYRSLGAFYELYTEYDAGNLPEAYYQSCINKMPHTLISKKCYLALENYKLNSFSIASSGALPVAEKYSLIKMKILSEDPSSSYGGFASQRDMQ